jgi:hypothetical protein
MTRSFRLSRPIRRSQRDSFREVHCVAWRPWRPEHNRAQVEQRLAGRTLQRRAAAGIRGAIYERIGSWATWAASLRDRRRTG